MSRTYDELLELVRGLPPPTEAERREQAISFAFGNVNISRAERGLPELPRSLFEEAYDRLHPK